MSFLQSDWRGRLREFEIFLEGDDMEGGLTRSQDDPFGIFMYPPYHERDVRKEIEMMATRMTNNGNRRPTIVSMAELLSISLDKASTNKKELFEAEKAIFPNGDCLELDEVRGNLEDVRDSIKAVIQDQASVAQMVVDRAGGLDPERDIIFVIRMGALYPVLSANDIVSQMSGKTKIPIIFFYPATREGRNRLLFMGSLKSTHLYRYRIF